MRVLYILGAIIFGALGGLGFLRTLEVLAVRHVLNPGSLAMSILFLLIAFVCMLRLRGSAPPAG